MHKSATKCNETVGKWCKNKHGASKIIDTLETYHTSSFALFVWIPTFKFIWCPLPPILSPKSKALPSFTLVSHWIPRPPPLWSRQPTGSVAIPPPYGEEGLPYKCDNYVYRGWKFDRLLDQNFWSFTLELPDHVFAPSLEAIKASSLGKM
jgi:hypothetical protein